MLIHERIITGAAHPAEPRRSVSDLWSKLALVAGGGAKLNLRSVQLQLYKCLYDHSCI
jgi:hypothetical protein